MNQANDLNPETYRVGVRSTLIFVILLTSSLFLGFALNFSIDSKLDSLLDKHVKNNRQCPMDFSSFKIGMLFNSISFKDLEISQRCTKKGELVFKSVSSSLGFPSISPIGPSLNTTIIDDHSKLELKSVHSFAEHAFKLSSTKLDMKSIEPLIPNVDLQGVFTVDTNILTSTKRIKTMQLRIKSTNFRVPSQNIQGFELPNLDIKNISIKATMNNHRTVNIEEVILGDDKAPIKANISGKIDLDSRSPRSSKLDLLAEVKFSKEFIESFSILNLFLDPKKQDDKGYYKLQITGPLSSPGTPKLLDP